MNLRSAGTTTLYYKDVASKLQSMHINRGNAKKKSGSIDEAQQDYQEALRLAPQTIDPQRWRMYLQKRLITKKT